MEIIQEKYNVFYGGSFALLLYGCNLKRDRNYIYDIDIIMPYYSKIRKSDLTSCGYPIDSIHDCGSKNSGNDFDRTISIYFKTNNDIEKDILKEINTINRSIKIDIKIDPHQTYNYVKYEDYEFKLSEIEPILEAKIKYSKNGQDKHKKDLMTLLGIDIHNIE
jgi:hypothetical protein